MPVLSTATKEDNMTWLISGQGRLGRHVEDPISSLHREINRAFSGLWGPDDGLMATAAASMPLRVDVKEDEKAFHITADLPGMNEKEVDVTFKEGILTIRGEKKVERDEKGDTWHVVERSSGSFARQLMLSANVDEGKIEAKFEKGVLTVTLPKQPIEQAKTKKIEIKTG